MAASASDYFIKVTPNFSTTIGGGGVAGAGTTTIPLTSVSNLPTDTAIELVINRVDSSGDETNNYETVRGVISGSNLTAVVRGVEGTAQAWAAGTVVEYLITADIQNRMATGTLLALEQTGRIKNEQWYAADAGANDTYAVTLSPVPAAYTTGMVVNFKANTANTGAATLNVNSLGAKTIKKLNDQDLANNDIESGQIVQVVYDGTNFQMQSQIANAPATTTVATDTIFDAKGDLVAGTGADAASKLTVGSNGQTLVADSSVSNGLKWSTLIGCKVYLSADQTNIGTGIVKVNFNTESFDTGAAYDTGTYKFTVPSGKAGYYLIILNAYIFETLTDGALCAAMIYRNNASIQQGNAACAATNVAAVPHCSTVVHLDATDYIEFYVQSGVANSDIYSPSTHSYGIIQQLTQD